MSEATETSGVVPPAGPTTRRPDLASLLRSYGVLVTFALLVAIVSAGNPAFLSPNNIANLLSQWAPAGIMAAGMTFVILTGGFDLSIASAYSLAAVVAAIIGQRVDPSLAFLAAIVAGLSFGLVNGLLVAVLRINPFITTVGTGFVLNGIALVMTQNAAFLVVDPRFAALGTGHWHGLPYAGMLLLAILILLQLVLSWTVYGQAVYAVGGNYEASRLSGIRVRQVVMSTYVLLGACIGRRRNVVGGRRRLDLGNGRRPRHHRHDFERLRSSRYQPILSGHHQRQHHRGCRRARPRYGKVHAAIILRRLTHGADCGANFRDVMANMDRARMQTG
jgi:ribose transport system permease protein